MAGNEDNNGDFDLSGLFGGAAGSGGGFMDMMFRVFEKKIEDEFHNMFSGGNDEPSGNRSDDNFLVSLLKSVLAPNTTPHFAGDTNTPAASTTPSAAVTSAGTSAVPIAPTEHTVAAQRLDLSGKTIVNGDSTANALSGQFRNAVNMGVDSAGLSKSGKQLASLDGVDMRGAHVLVELGYNDAGKLPNTSPAVMDGYRNLYKQHVDQIKADGGTPVLIGVAPAQKPLEYRKNGELHVQTPEEFRAWNAKLAAINDVIKTVAQQEGATYVSPDGAITRGGTTVTAGPSAVQERAGDGIHFSSQGNRDMAQLAKTAIGMTPLLS